MESLKALLFDGQGAQEVGMGKDLYEADPHVRHLYEEAERLLGIPLRSVSFSGPAEALTETVIAQPALFVHGFALFTLLQNRLPAFRFSAVAGLSLGELTAHAAAGTFSYSDGLRLVKERALAIQRAAEESPGSMVALVGADRKVADAIAREAQVDVANYNAPGQIVLSGSRRGLALVPELASRRGVRKVIPLEVSGAFHSRLMRKAAEELQAFLEDFPLEIPRVPVYSNFLGRPVREPAEIRRSLAAQIEGSVQWEDCMRGMLDCGVRQFVELGPRPVLLGLLRRIEPRAAGIALATLEDLQSHEHELVEG
ncbi:ACP S-malonyltransferase [Methylacidimicrobium sp. B4]|uniref:ACP S-malonyltransferase n=1 Tax=Methylacidimicrobium sp. B4 TaxID=2796139 RepID=UPI001A8FDB2A|nr:ACP S-malonyltransferase [Methylacidimicrobium sp. B4]QSR84538.1 ACP S-malonyltransferase [Methylacidimicrobium sp. B4]